MHHSWTLSSLIGALLLAPPLLAQEARSGGGANAQIMQQYQQLAAERGRLQADNARLTKDNDDLKKQLKDSKAGTSQLAALKARSDSAQAQIAAAQAARSTSEQSLKATRDKLQDLLNHYRDSVSALREVESKKTLLEQQVLAGNEKYDLCVVRNDELAHITNEVLERYEHQSGFTSVARTEPFTRITQTRVENLVLEDRQRAEELRVQKREAVVGSTPNSAVPANH